MTGPSGEKPVLYPPSPETIGRARVRDYDSVYARSIRDREGYWAEEASKLDWFRKWDRVLDSSKKPFYRWFDGGKINIVHNAIDRHAEGKRADKVAFLWEGEDGATRSFTYRELRRAVSRTARHLLDLGVKKGEIVTIYMPQVPELPIAMLACARIGAVHSVVYGGFSADALATRIQDAKSRVLFTADGGFRRGKATDLKAIADEAMAQCPGIEASVVVKRTAHDVSMKAGRDRWFHELETALDARGPSASEVPCAETEAEDPLFVLYTSGTTGKPKGLVHVHGGYAVYVSTTHRDVFDIQDSDLYWCAADPGWITGHSYLVYGPLLNGASVLLYEGAPNHPDPGRWWRMIETRKVSILYTSPTAIRGLMRFGEEWPAKSDLSSLRLLGSVGEPINPEAWRWYWTNIGRGKCAIMDTWWQTETGGFMITPLPVTPLKPGSCTKPFFGNEIAVVNDAMEELPPGQEGSLVVKNVWPGMARTCLGDPERYVETYWKPYEKKGWFKTGDSARRDEDGYVWVIGRQDDVIKVSGYRLGTAEIESALVSHPSVAEAAAIGLPHELKGNAIHSFVLLRAGEKGSPALEEELKMHVSKHLGPIAKPEAVLFLDVLPKTRSGKIMRRVLRARAQGLDPGDVSTLEE